MRAIFSVYDKNGVVDFGRSMAKAGLELVSTGGTYRELHEAGLPVSTVSEITGFPEIMDGRVKTLHPLVHGGILARRDVSGDLDQLAVHGIKAVDLVTVNLYPFADTVAKPEVDLNEALENIDIGGPTMVRAAAKNFPYVIVIVDTSDYTWIAERICKGGPAAITMAERRSLAAKAFNHVAIYDKAIARYLATSQTQSGNESQTLTETMTISLQRTAKLRYGENPHQGAALYTDLDSESLEGVGNSQQLHGKELSYNNLLDADAAWRVVTDFDEGAAVIIKHNNPCGLALANEQEVAYKRAFDGDPVSAYGGIVGFNRTVTTSTVKAMNGVFYEVVLAPEYEPEALEILQTRKNLRVLSIKAIREVGLNPDIRRISGGLLVQDTDEYPEDRTKWKVVSKKRPSADQMIDLAFAWKAAKHIKSNAIVLVRDQALLGMGAGQPNRLNSIHLAVRAAGERASGTVLASDAFFPFADNVNMAAAAGVTAVVQPGGSIRDEEVINTADELGLAMIFTDTRHFRH